MKRSVFNPTAKPLWIGVFCFIFILLLAALFPLRDKDRERYKELLATSDPTHRHEYSSLTSSHHVRERVNKLIHYQEETPLFIQISSPHSDLYVFRRDEAMEVIEELKEVDCIMQEELYYLLADGKEGIKMEEGWMILKGQDSSNREEWLPVPKDALPMQRVRYLHARRGCYNYNTLTFTGQEVTIQKYTLDGHTPTRSLEGKKPQMNGQAKSCSFTLEL